MTSARASAPALLLLATSLATSLATVIGSGCSDDRRPASPGPTTTLPSCTLPVCDTTCACDQTTSCDPACSDCDPECKNCRAADAECTTPRDAGPRPVDSGTPGPGDGGPQPPGDGGPGRDATSPQPPSDGGPDQDAGGCSFPLSQGLSEPCCTENGIDACGAGLFCAAFDGRIQPTCYAERSRQQGQSCGDDLHCSNRNCPASTHVCGPGPGDRCTPGDTPCASDDGTPYFCNPSNERCELTPTSCDPATHLPCEPSESCYSRYGPNDTLINECAPTGNTATGDMCQSSTECVRGNVCLAPFQPRCFRTCDANRPCPSGPCIPSTIGIDVCLSDT